jgi:hypothetical protein
MKMLNDKGFNGVLRAIKNTSDKLAENIHAAGLFAIAQANEHGNIGFATRLIDAMGKKHDAQRVVTWLCAHGKIGVSKGLIVFRKRKDVLPENLDAWLEKADASPYWVYTAQKKLVENFDYLAMLQSIIHKHDKVIPEKIAAGFEVNETNIAALVEVRKLVEKLAPKAVPVAA